MTEVKTTTTKKAAHKAAATKPEAKNTSGKFAIIKTGGKQYLVEAGRYYEFEKLEGEEGTKVEFAEVLLVADGDNVKVGKPFVEGAKVTGKILSQFKHETVRVFKYKKRKRTRKTYGHRQPLTKVEITSIN